MGAIVDVSELLLELGLSGSPSDEERAVASASIMKAEGAVKRFLRYDPVQRLRTEYHPRRDYNYLTAQAVWEATDTEAYLRRVAEAATSELQVQHLPIRSDPAIDLRVDYDGRSGAKSGSFAADTLKTEGTDYWPNYDGTDSSGDRICRDGIVRSIGQWPTSPGCVRVIYTAGYSPAELRGSDNIIDASPIWEAVLVEAKRRAESMFVRKKSASVGFVAGPKTSESLGSYRYSVDSALATKLYGDSKDLTDSTMQRLADFVNWGWE